MPRGGRRGHRMQALYALVLMTGLSGCASAVSGTVENRAERASNQYVTVGETKFAYRSFGDGAPIIFLNRFRATMDHWDPAFVNAVAMKRRVILFDNAGVGLSTGEAADTFPKMADDVARFAQGLGIDRADVVGWSIGGMVAQALLVRHPQLVRRAVLLATIPPGGTAEQFPPISEEVRRAAGNPTGGTENDLLFLFFAPSESSRAAGRESLARLRTRVGPPSPPVRAETMRNQISALTDWYRGSSGILKSYRQIDRPVLVANGRQDAMFSAQQSFVLAREIPSAQLAIYPDSGHAFMFQYPDTFARLMLDFLDDPRWKP